MVKFFESLEFMIGLRLDNLVNNSWVYLSFVLVKRLGFLVLRRVAVTNVCQFPFANPIEYNSRCLPIGEVPFYL